jgi:hypothetical protein
MEAKLCFIGRTLMENRSGLIVDARLTLADGHAERIAALSLIEPRAGRPRAVTLGADKAYDAEDFINELRSMNVRAHVAQNDNGRVPSRWSRHSLGAPTLRDSAKLGSDRLPAPPATQAASPRTHLVSSPHPPVAGIDHPSPEPGREKTVASTAILLNISVRLFWA